VATSGSFFHGQKQSLGVNTAGGDSVAIKMPSPSLSGLAGFFLKLGTLAFGGPAAHIGMMEDELVRRRQWISADDFLDLMAVSNLLPGPSSTELAILIGYRLCGFAGLLVAGVCFILPAFLMVGVLAWSYVRYGSLPAVAGLLYGVKPAVIAIVLQALWRLGRAAIKSPALGTMGVLALLACFLGCSPLLVLFGTAIVGAAIYAIRQRSATQAAAGFWIPTFPIAAGTPALAGLGGIFLVFVKLGCIVFGSGYVLLAFLRADLVIHRHWLTEGQLLDSVAVGQVTPGPVFTTATFIGYVLAGPKGALVATAGIFAPAFIFVAAAGPLVHRVRASKIASMFLDNLNVASLALMAYVTYQLARSAITDWATLGLALISAVVLFSLGINSAWVVAAGAIIGLGLTLLGMH
jgi:chromate transporter